METEICYLVHSLDKQKLCKNLPDAKEAAKRMAWLNGTAEITEFQTVKNSWKPVCRAVASAEYLVYDEK